MFYILYPRDLGFESLFHDPYNPEFVLDLYGTVVCLNNHDSWLGPYCFLWNSAWGQPATLFSFRPTHAQMFFLPQEQETVPALVKGV